ncbi:DUF2949 domain-containing protein [Lyngbya confervoides]|uniref:DUF2949 domain-containing protein n=1 Tax=Lyngbya confervoides BDU141951 TaxID=1574623 RepID=A0ABD4T8H2_9CYAN|nr:DUF2949 domain-containing protein [Lyngbya confervoides]MCM1984793.1 DUF2949 domain-containing protein [Lyngbya confervoides BDU141951]
METGKQKQLLQFLTTHLQVSHASISLALKHREQDPGPLPIVLWNYGFLTLDQLSQIYDWLETS